MKHTLITLATLLLMAATATAQVPAGADPALTNNVQLTWDSTQAAALRSLWNEDFAGQIAAWNTATNADPTYAASNSVPVKSTFAVWASGWTKPIMATALAEKEAQRKWRVQQSLATAHKTAADLFAATWGLLTPAQQVTQSNVWWTANQANQ